MSSITSLRAIPPHLNPLDRLLPCSLLDTNLTLAPHTTQTHFTSIIPIARQVLSELDILSINSVLSDVRK